MMYCRFRGLASSPGAAHSCVAAVARQQRAATMLKAWMHMAYHHHAVTCTVSPRVAPVTGNGGFSLTTLNSFE
jgi:hypothetical protein